jgi:hypothetical protein
MERTQRASGSYYRLTMVGTKCWRSSAPRLGVVITDIFMSEADDATLEKPFKVDALLKTLKPLRN